MKKLYTLLVFSFVAVILAAKPINKTEALNVAKKYFSTYQSQLMRAKSNLNYELVYTESENSAQYTTDNSLNYFYVFNIGENEGFIIISADSRTKKVLGYSNVGNFRYNTIPENLKLWLIEYSQEIKYAIENLPDIDSSNVTTDLNVSLKTNAQKNGVEPLLKNISYNQDAPYNDSCPALNGEKTVTGCGATALVQVMRYHQWPINGMGTKTYTSRTNSFSLTADFGNTTYDWGNMPETYNASSTNIQKAAIAKLMLHAGIAINMDYNTASNGGSSSYTTDVPLALYNYFGYDAGVQIYMRKYFTENVWKEKLISEIDAKRPVLYRGSNASNSGHIFVCDGYDANGLFHFNWGWGGISNGYFEVTALNPDNQGIGSNNGGYNFGHYMVTGIQKPIEGSLHSPLIGIDSISPSLKSISRTGNVTLSIKKFVNIGAFDYLQNMMGVSLILSQNGEVKDTLSIDNEWGSNLPPGYYYSSLGYSVSFKTSLPNGDYQITALYRNEKNKFVPTCINTSGKEFLTATITDQTIYFSQPNTNADLSLIASPTTPYNLYQNKNGQFEIKIKNSGVRDYYAQIGIKLIKTDDPTVTQNVVSSLTSILAGDTKTIQLGDSVKVAPGTYYLNICYDSNNNQSVSSFPTTLMGPSQYIVTVTVNPTPSNLPILTLTVNSASIPKTITKGIPFTIKADLLNTGGLFDNNVIAFIFPSSPGTSLGYYGYQKQVIDKDQTKTIDFTGEITTLDAGDYRTAMYYYNGTKWSRLSDIYTFTLLENLTPVDNTTSDILKILENPVGSELKVIIPANIKYLMLYNLQGKQIKSVEISGEKLAKINVNYLEPGIYILKAISTDGEIYNAKVIKK